MSITKKELIEALDESFPKSLLSDNLLVPALIRVTLEELFRALPDDKPEDLPTDSPCDECEDFDPFLPDWQQRLIAEVKRNGLEGYGGDGFVFNMQTLLDFMGNEFKRMGDEIMSGIEVEGMVTRDVERVLKERGVR